MKRWFLLLALPAQLLASDYYPNYAELAKHEREGLDFRVVTEDRGSPLTVMAIHGGDIEIVTSGVARAIAGDDLNLYLFEGIRPTDNKRLHITSTRFDEPRALELARRSSVCISVHGFLENRRNAVCVGGGSARLRERTAEVLAKSGLGLEVESPCIRFGGDAPENIVNRCHEPGLQLETSTALRRKMDADPAFRASFARVIRGVVLDQR